MTAIILITALALLGGLATVHALVRGDRGTLPPPTSHARDPQFLPAAGHDVRAA